MGLFLAVAQGSTQEPRFVHLAWTPPGARRRIVVVGKGITFDSGGLSLKTNEGMLDMKTDMAGAAAVLAAVVAAAEEKLAVEVHALAACTENMPSGNAYKLGDVIRSLDGKTVEINNTDAEGRLTLADALSFGARFKPDAVLDFATLTGACMVALGPHTAGVMSNDDALANELLSAAQRAGEEMWRLPLPPRLAEQLKSDVADFKNTGERWGGALTAGPLPAGVRRQRSLGARRHCRARRARAKSTATSRKAGRASPPPQSSSFCDAPQPEPRQIRVATNANQGRERSSNGPRMR